MSASSGSDSARRDREGHAALGWVLFSLLVLAALVVLRWFGRFHSPLLHYGGEAVLVGLFVLGAFRLDASLARHDLTPAGALFPRWRRFARPDGETFDPLLLLRFAACLLVFLGHGFTGYFLASDLPQRIGAGSSAFLVCSPQYCGLWVFFVLSGYLMGKGFVTGRYLLAERGLLDFYRNRVLRIVPLYYATALAVLLFQRPDLLHPGFVVSFLFLDYHGLDGAPLLNPMWSIGTEFEFYLLAPFCFLLFARLFGRRTWPALLGIVAVLAAEAAYRHAMHPADFGGWWRYVYSPLAGNLDLFLCGFLLNYPVEACREKLPDWGWGWLALAGGVFVPFYVLASRNNAWATVLQHPRACQTLWLLFPTLTALATAAIIFLLEAPTLVIVARGKWDPRPGFFRGISFLGTVTYAFYLWHAPILDAAAGGPQIAREHAPALAEAARLVAWNGLKILGVAVLTYFLIERPFDLRKKRFPRQTPPA